MLEVVILAGIVLCVLPANVFAVWYGLRGSWRDSAEGCALLLFASAFAAWLDLELLYGVLPLPGDEYVSVGLLALIGVGTWRMLVVWARSRRRRPDPS